MSVSADFYKFSKRKNSTKQPTGTGTVYNVDLKSGTSFLSPTLLLNNSGYPDFNYVVFNGWYYFIRDIVSVRNDLWEVYCTIDALATAKSAITSSTQFVSYSSQLGDSWLQDTRIPVKKNATVAKNTTTMNFLFNTAGFYVLSAVGENGCQTYGLDRAMINNLIQNVNYWIQTDEGKAQNPIISPSISPSTTTSDDIHELTNELSQSIANLGTQLNATLAHLGLSMVQNGLFGNAYTDAPSCVRSCIWVPFFASFFVSGAGGATIHLGAYDTGVPALPCKTDPESRTVSVNIPWQYTDWRRTVCEEIYLYLPLVGLVNIPSDEIVNETQIDVTWSATASDGCIAYLVKAGNQVIGTYGANCAVNYPIGFSQQASAGEVYQSFLAGAEKTMSVGLQGATSLNPIGMMTGAIGASMSALNGTYDTINTALTRHNSCIGGIGGGAGVGLDLDLTCFSVAHPTIVNPSDMLQTMGLPTMKPMSLSGLTGYCECANAHVEADLPSPILDAVDNYLNSGFFIE